MDNEQKAVYEFHKTFDLEINTKPTLPEPREMSLRLELIQEECRELIDAMLKRDIVNVADNMVDLIYVIKGAALAYGIDLEPIFAEVHRSNMTKVGGHKREDGKWMKPDTYEKPQILELLKKQGFEQS